MCLTVIAGSDPLNLSKTAYEELGRRYAADRLSQLRSVVHTTDVDMADGHGTHYDHASSQSRDYRSRSTAHGASARTQPTGLSVDDLASSASRCECTAALYFGLAFFMISFRVDFELNADSHPHKSRRSRAHSLRAQLSQIDEMLEAFVPHHILVFIFTPYFSLSRIHCHSCFIFSTDHNSTLTCAGPNASAEHGKTSMCPRVDSLWAATTLTTLQPSAARSFQGHFRAMYVWAAHPRPMLTPPTVTVSCL
jgi:hypothetical protein